jgi:hypothetical protein
VASGVERRSELAGEATDHCLARAVVCGVTTLSRRELVDLLLDARPRAIAKAEAAVGNG